MNPTASNAELADRRTFKYFFRTDYTDLSNNKAVVELLKYFGWKRIGLINDASANTEVSNSSRIVHVHSTTL